MIADIAVPLRVFGNFSYRIPEEWQNTIQKGSIVKVAFRNRQTFGFVVETSETEPQTTFKIKDVEGLLVAGPVFDQSMLSFFQWVAQYYCHPLGEVISTAIPKDCWQGHVPKKSTRKSKSMGSVSDLSQLPQSIRHELTEEQKNAVGVVLESPIEKPFLLHGVTGSGKTEVYMRILEAVLEKGQGAIVLVPEIALTPQLLSRFLSRFPGKVALLHSDLTAKERFEQWRLINAGEVSIVVGARSAIFAPIKNLGMIIVDEEHEPSYKQEDHLRYNARDLAVVRASLHKCKVLLGSATPSLESYSNAKNGRYIYLELGNRISQHALPVTRVVDMSDKLAWHSAKTPWLSSVLVEKIRSQLRQGRQAILFLNRLGFSHFLFCEDCGHTWRCNHCDVSLTYYQSPPHLKCHYCGTERVIPNSCDKCHGLSIQKVGIGTEQVETTIREVFPTARIARFDRSKIKNRKQLEETIRSIHAKEVDLIIGTQMLAKGHDFPEVGLVGILMADATLNFPDFRASERTFQMITQVSGRAGRAEIPGEVIVQTINPENPTIELATKNLTEDFYAKELLTRKTFVFPPYCRLAMLRFQAANPTKVKEFATQLCRDLMQQAGREAPLELLGPSEAPLSRLKGMYRWQALLKANSSQTLHQWLEWLQTAAQKKKSPVKFAVDVDPIHAL